MIVSYRHKGSELYANKGNRWTLQQNRVEKIKLILTRLGAEKNSQTMNQLGSSFHALSRELDGFYAVKVSGNYRIIFRFEGENAHDVDYLDYH